MVSEPSEHSISYSDIGKNLELHIKSVATYRIKKIEVKRSDAIDQIKITYDDGAIWHNGHDGGKGDPRCLIMTKGEYLVRVTHERLFNYKCAGAAVEFETNKGRIFAYHPLRMATKWKNEQTTIIAPEGKEIVSLIIRRGVLVGSEQQPVPPSEIVKHSNSWYVIASYGEKEDTEGEGITYDEFFTKSEALAKWNMQLLVVNEKHGRGAILIDCLKSKVLKKAGNSKVVKECTQKATEAGYCAPNREEDVSMFEVVRMLYLLLAKKSDSWKFITVILLQFASTCCDIESQLLGGHLLSLVTGNQSDLRTSNRYVKFTCNYITQCDGSNLNLSKAIIISYISVVIGDYAFHVCQQYIYSMLCDAKTHQLRCDALSHALSLDQRYFDTHSTSQVRGSMNVHSISTLICWNIPYLVTLTIRYLVTAYYLITIDIYLGGFCVLLMFAIKYCLLYPIGLFEKQVGRMSSKLDLINGQIVGDALNMITTVKMFSKERFHINEHNACQQRVIKNLNNVVVLRCFQTFCNGILQAAIFGGALYYGLLYIKESGITAGELTGFFFLFRQFQYIFNAIRYLGERIVREFRDIERFMALMDEKPSIVDGPLKPTQLNGDIVFNDVHFTYPSRPGEEVLKGFNMCIPAHKMTAIVGDSGSGKSTIAKLIMRLYDVTSGSITIDGEDIAKYDRKYLHSVMAIVDQNPTLFDSSLAENIGYGVTEEMFTNEQVYDAAELANCGFISKFRGGFDTHAGSSGSQLSGGQKQRVSIARATIRDPKILILDEATSSLDAANEREVQEALDKVMSGRTIIVIAHRLSTIKNADDIICMKDGEMVERGTHDDLMAQEGVYYNLISKQIVDKKEKRIS